MTTTFRDHACPWCGRPNDAITNSEQNEGPQGNIPKTGDMSICFGCHNFLVFTDTGSRRASPEERDEAMKASNVRDALEALQRGMRPRQAAKYKSS